MQCNGGNFCDNGFDAEFTKDDENAYHVMRNAWSNEYEDHAYYVLIQGGSSKQWRMSISDDWSHNLYIGGMKISRTNKN